MNRPQYPPTSPRDTTLFLVAVEERIHTLLVTLDTRIQVYRDTQHFLGSADLTLPGCVISDLSVTCTITGIGLIQELRRRCLELPVVLMSRLSDMSLAVKAMSEGAITLLSSDCNAEQLFEAVHRGVEANRDQRLQGEERRSLVSLIAGLSDKECQVLKQIVAGRHNKEIAAELNVSVRSIENWRKSGMEKMQIDSSLELMRKLMRAGFRDWPDITQQQ